MSWTLWKCCFWQDHKMLRVQRFLGLQNFVVGPYLYGCFCLFLILQVQKETMTKRCSVTYSKSDLKTSSWASWLTVRFSFHYASFPLLLIFLPWMIVPNLAHEFTFPWLKHFHSEVFPLIIKIADWNLIQILLFKLFCIYLTNPPSSQKSELQVTHKICNRHQNL